MSKPEIFISYAREHEELISQLAGLLKIGNPNVFVDREGIKPGDEWEAVIVSSLTEASTIVVIWCYHAEASEWVKKEFELGITQNKRIVPVRIDSTPVPERLQKYQWLDFSTVFQHEAVPLTERAAPVGPHDAAIESLVDEASKYLTAQTALQIVFRCWDDSPVAWTGVSTLPPVAQLAAGIREAIMAQ